MAGSFHQPGADEANEPSGYGERGYLFMQYDHSEQQRHYRDQKRRT
jgi:hypothetical protein